MKTAVKLFITGLVMASACVKADSVALMEQGRSELVSNLIDPRLAPERRLEKLAILQRSQMSLEQIVVRDEELVPQHHGSKQLFTRFESNFLVHAAFERNRSLGEHWFSLVGLTSDAMRHADVGRR